MKLLWEALNKTEKNAFEKKNSSFPNGLRWPATAEKQTVDSHLAGPGLIALVTWDPFFPKECSPHESFMEASPPRFRVKSSTERRLVSILVLRFTIRIDPWMLCIDYWVHCWLYSWYVQEYKILKTGHTDKMRIPNAPPHVWQ